jgi:CheY-like chemotaxis protein
VEAEERKPIVLVADDDADMRHALSLLLSRGGYQVLETGDGAQALELLAAAADGDGPRPDVLILDFCMPELSGIGVLKVLRRFGRVPPTILITGFPGSSVEAFARSAGALTVLRKPVDGDDVLAAVHAALAKARLTMT